MVIGELKAYTGGEINTCDPDIHEADTLVISGGKIVAVGRRDDILPALPSNSEVIELEGRSIIPGLTDTHVHLATHALEERTVQCRDFYDPNIDSVTEILNRMERFARDVEHGRWIVGTGSPMQGHRLSEGRLPTLEEIDKAVPDHPAYISFGAHVTLANSLALQLGGITRDTPDPDGGRIVRDPNTGEPTGLLLERARFAVQGNLVKLFGRGATEQCMEVAVKDCAARGVTSIHEILKYRDEFSAWQSLARRGALPIRAMLLIRAIESDFDVRAMPSLGMEAGFGSERLWFGGAKISIDGGFTGGSAAFHHRGCEEEGHDAAIVRIGKDELDATVKLYHEAGIRICVHAIGDRAADMAFDAFEAAGPRKPELRHRIEHLGNFLFDGARQARALELGLEPVPNASFLYFLGRQVWDLLGGGEESFQAFPFRSMLRQGFHMATGADGTGYWPVDALRDMSAMMERQSFDGVVFSPEERLTAAEALYCQTMNAAWLAYREDSMGSLVPGKLADFVVVECESFEQLSPREVRSLEVNRTVVGGDVVFEAKNN